MYINNIKCKNETGSIIWEDRVGKTDRHVNSININVHLYMYLRRPFEPTSSPCDYAQRTTTHVEAHTHEQLNVLMPDAAQNGHFI